MEENPDFSALIFVADKFEELFKLCQEEEERRSFLERLLAATSSGPYQKRPALNLVITLRADFFGYATSYRPLADALQSANLILGPMNRKEMQEAIEKPAQKHKVIMEDGLTERILEAISHTPGNLPLL